MSAPSEVRSLYQFECADCGQKYVAWREWCICSISSPQSVNGFVNCCGRLRPIATDASAATVDQAAAPAQAGTLFEVWSAVNDRTKEGLVEISMSRPRARLDLAEARDLVRALEEAIATAETAATAADRKPS